MAMQPIEEFYNVQRNILDRVDSDSFDEEQAKGLALLFGLDVFQKLIKRNENRVDDEIEVEKTAEVLRNGRNDVLWQNRQQVLKDYDTIQNDGRYAFFDAEAEAAFNNPLTHENSQIKINEGKSDWTFDPREFEDEKSPMYKVKDNWKRDYIDDVLYKDFMDTYDKIDQNITTFDEFNKDNAELTRLNIKYANRPSNRSFLRQWNLFGRRRTKKLKADVETARKNYDTLLKTREGYLNPTDEKFVVKELTQEMYDTGLTFDEFDFKNIDAYRGLTPDAQTTAIQKFKDNERNGIKNTSYEVSKIITLTELNENFNKQTMLYNEIKNTDPDFLKTKPEQLQNQSYDDYINSEPYKKWLQSRDDAYAPNSKKDLKAKERAGFNLNFSEQTILSIRDNLGYIAEIQQFKKDLDDNKITQEEYDIKVNEYINKTVTNALNQELGTVDAKQKYINETTQFLQNQHFNFINSREGEDYILGQWKNEQNQKRTFYNNNLQEGKEPVLLLTDEAARKEYSLQKQDEIIAYAALLTRYLVIDPTTGIIGRNPELREEDEFFDIPPDFFDEMD